MASSSPAIHASRPGPYVDPHRQAEYPVLLGKSLQDTSGARKNFISVQYNWKPKNVSSKQKDVITKANGEVGGDAPYLLTIQEPGAETRPYRYAGNIRQTESQDGSAKSSLKDQTTSLALVFDQEKSAFILEKVSANLDLNLTSAPGQSRGDVQALPQLPLHTQAEKPLAYTQKPTPSSSSDDDEPDGANPYDYRHFLEEARGNAEKGLGSRTPIPGGISGLPSPVPGPSRVHAGSGTGTPVHRPVTSAPSAQVKKRKMPDEHRRDSRPTTPSTQNKNIATKPKPKPTTSASMLSSSSSSKPKPLSKERISDSDEEIGDTITLSRPSKATNTNPRSKTHHKATTANPAYPNSPRIEVDEAADLVIDMGSPPPVTARRRPYSGASGGGISSSPFAMARSSSSLQPTKSTPAAVPAQFRAGSDSEEEQDAEGEPDDDVVMRDVDVDVDTDPDADADADGDVEDLVLGSPRASTTTTRAASVSMSMSMSRVDVDDDGDEDEDDELAAELEAALGSDDEDANVNVNVNGGGRTGGGVGLGISTNGGGNVVGGVSGAEDDESEVSEEE